MSTGVVTPEAVLLELPTAGTATRAFARLIDVAIQGVLFVGLLVLAAFTLPSGVSPLLIGLSISFTVLLAVPILTEALWRGRSPGKAAMGLRVVGADGAPETPRQAVVRGLVALVDLYLSLGFVAILTSAATPASQRGGDLAAGTVVIRARALTASATPVAFLPPTGYEAYVATLDVGALDDEDFALVRETLLRSRALAPHRRDAVQSELAEAVRQRLGHQLPGPMDPGTWLICVASAHQQRQGGLLADAAAGLATVAPTHVPRR